jgi:hypothetical protein
MMVTGARQRPEEPEVKNIKILTLSPHSIGLEVGCPKKLAYSDTNLPI